MRKLTETQLIQLAFDLYTCGHYKKAIARRLSEESGRRWLPIAVKRLLADPAHAGTVVSVDTWARAQRKQKFTHLLSGFFTCAHCREPYIYATDRYGQTLYRYYACSSRHRDSRACTGAMIRMEELESKVWESLKGWKIPHAPAGTRAADALRLRRMLSLDDATEGERAELVRRFLVGITVRTVGKKNPVRRVEIEFVKVKETARARAA